VPQPQPTEGHYRLRVIIEYLGWDGRIDTRRLFYYILITFYRMAMFWVSFIFSSLDTSFSGVFILFEKKGCSWKYGPCGTIHLYKYKLGSHESWLPLFCVKKNCKFGPSLADNLNVDCYLTLHYIFFNSIHTHKYLQYSPYPWSTSKYILDILQFTRITEITETQKPTKPIYSKTF